MSTTKTAQNLAAISLRVVYGLMILAMLFSAWGIKPVSADPFYTISGNAGVSDVEINYTGTSSGSTTTDGTGAYSFLVDTGWSGTVTPSKAGYSFTPGSMTYDNVQADLPGQDYTATALTYTISGSTGATGADATIAYTGGSTTADGSGAYSFTVSHGWSGTVIPSKDGYTFTPISRTYTDVTSDQMNQDYTAALNEYTISGNAGADSVTITFTGGSTTSDSSGDYSFSVSQGWSGTATPSKTGFSFWPASISYTNVTENQTLQNYSARPTVFTFASMGDAHLEPTYFASTVNQIATLNPAFALFNGDLEDAGVVTSQMDPMIDVLKSADLFNNTFLIRGNHDDHVADSATLWENYFETAPNIQVRPEYVVNKIGLDSSTDNLTFSFEYGNSIFIGIDVPEDIDELSATEEAFLDDRLTYAESQGLTHAFIFLHSAEYCVESVHCTCDTRANVNCTPPSFIDIINSHPIVSATIHGHEHVLAWTHMDNSRVSALTRSYEQFITSPAGGVSYHQLVFPERVDYVYADMAGSDHGFATISVDGLSFTYSIYKTGVTEPVWTHSFSKINSIPTISDISDTTTDEDTATGPISFTVDDVELAPAYLTVTATSSNPTLVPDANISLGGSGGDRTINIMPAANQSGSVTITVSVNDGSDTVSDTFLLTINPVNDAPVANAQSVSMPWNSSLNIVLTGTDLEDDPLIYSIVDEPIHGSLSGSGENQTYTPTEGYSGIDFFTFRVNDGTADSSPATVNIDVYAYSISGNAGVAGATLNYTDGSPKSVTADGSGLYSLQVPAGWSGTVIPTMAGYTFSPASMSYTDVQSNQTGQNYTTSIVMFTLSGNAGVAGATLSYLDGTLKTVTADGSGFYSFEIPYNWSGMVTPSLTGYGFRPATRSYTNVTTNLDAQDYSTTTSRVYYVDNTNPACTDVGQVGSMDVPFCTIGRGAYLVDVGQIVHVIHGTYPETVYPNRSGTVENPIFYWADAGVTLTGQPGTPTASYSGFAISTKSYIVIDGFHITNTSQKGMYIDASSYITISNNRVSYAGNTSQNHPYEQGIYLRNTTNSIITGNTTDHNTCIGIRVVGGGNNLIGNNLSYGNFSLIETDAAGIELTGSSNNTIINNIVYSNEDSGINIYYWDTYSIGSSNNLVIGNLSYENGDHGIDVHRSPYNTIVGNTIHGNGTVGINFEGEVGSASDHGTAINNVLSGNGFTPPAGSWGGNLRVDSASSDGTTIDYNLYNRLEATAQIVWNDIQYISLAAFRAAVSGQEANGLEGDPLFVSPVPPVLRQTGVPYLGQGMLGDYNIMAGSPAIDSANSDAPNEPLYDLAGNNRIDDPSTPNTGVGVRTYDDRGAYEYLPAGPSLPVVTTQAVTGITMTTATGNGNIAAPGLPAPTEHGIVWGLSANPTTADSKTMEGPVSGAGAFTSAITGLIPGTLYHVRAYATNELGTAYGEDVIFTTHIPPTVTTQAVTSITATTATGNGNVTSLGVPNPTEHGVVWSTAVNPTLADSKTTDGPVSAIGAFTSNITGLTPGTLYHVRAYATNSASTAYGEDFTFTTQIEPTVTTQVVTEITTTTATGNGNITFLGIPNPTQHGVVWSTAANPTIADSKTTDGPVSTTGAFTSAIIGLTPNTLYHVRAYATNAVNTAYGEDVTFTTLEAPTVTTQAVTDITTTTATGNGNIIVLGTENPTQHGMVWSTAENPTIADNKTEDGPIGATGAFTSAITGLTSGTLYHVRAYATNIAGTAYGEDVTFTTWIAPAVTTQAVTNIEHTTALANGTITSLGVPNPIQYGVIWDINPDPTVALSTRTEQGSITVAGAFTSNITGLNPGQAYHVRAYATNSVGTAYGEDVVFTTLSSDTFTTTPVTDARSGADVSGTGSVAWVTPGYITADDTNYAQASLPTSSTSHYLQGTDYGFAIPDNAVINGITVTIGRYASANTYMRDSVVRLIKGGLVSGVNKAVTSYWPSGSPVSTTYGGSDDLWETTWTPTDINASNFGVALSATNTSTSYGRIAYVDFMQIAVTYTVSVVSSNTSVNCGAGTPVLDIGSSITCVATVVRGAGTYTPSGDVAWTTDGNGSFTPTSCSLSGESGTATCSVSYTPGSVGTGAHVVTAAYPGDANFNASSGSQAITVNKIAASVTAIAASKTYGEADPALTGTLTGFLPADNVTATYSRTPGETVAGSPYTISATLSPEGVLTNYEITYNTADFTINRRNASVTPDAASKLIGEVDPVLTGTLSGFLPEDNVTATYSRVAGETVEGSPYTISATLSPVEVLGNYNITYNTANFMINPRPEAYALNINVVGNGIVTKDPDTATYQYGTVITLAAIPDEGWSFGSWSENVANGLVTITGETTVTATFILNNVAPSFTSAPIESVDEDSVYSYNTTTTDQNTGDILNITAFTRPVWLTLTDNGDGTATLAGTPTNANVGNHAVILRVSDGLLTADQTFSIAVVNTNDSPYFTSTPVDNAAEETPYTYAIAAADPDAGATLTITAPVIPSWLTLTDNGDGTAILTGTPSTENAGIHNVTLNVNDGTVGADQVFTIDVGNANPGPSFTSAPVTSVDEDAEYTYSITTTDPDLGATLAVSAGVLPTWLTLTDHGDGTATLTGTPDNNAVGDHIVVLQVSDGVEFAYQLFTITVANTNDAPVMSQPADQNSLKGATVNRQLNAMDVDADSTLTYSASGLPGGLSIDPASGLIGGTVTGDAGAYTVTATVDDGVGGTDTKIFTWTINEPATYTLIVNVVGNGTVAKDPDQATYLTGDVVMLTATPDEDWNFFSWSGCTGTGNTCSVTMNGSRAVTATFTYGLTAGIYDDANAAITYTGNWVNWGTSGPYLETLHYSYGVGDSAQLSFTGRQIKLTYAAGVGGGMVDVYVDGARMGSIDQSSDTWEWQKTWTSELLSAGSHTLSLVLASTSFITIDAIEIIDAPMVLSTGTYDDPNPALGYSGNWRSWDGGAGPYLETLRYTYRVGDSVLVYFSGQQVKLTYAAGVGGGIVDVYIDDVLVTSIDQSSQTWDWQATWTSERLASGTHSLHVVFASGVFASIDAIQVLVAPDTLAVGLYDDANPSIGYSGSWLSWNDGSGPYLDTMRYSYRVGDSIQVYFSGQQIKLTYLAGPTAGVMDVYVDGNRVASINQQSGTWDWQATWISEMLPAGDHNLRLVFVSGGFTSLDTFQVLGVPETLPDGLYDDAYPALSFSGSWAAMTGAGGPYQGTMRYSYRVGDSVQLYFTGRQIKLSFLAGATAGIMDVYVDGSKVDSINQYSDAWVWQKTWTSDVFAEGTHSLRLVYLSGGFTSVDSLQVVEAPTILLPGTYDDADASFGYTGSWVTMVGTTGPYLGTLHYTYNLGDTVQVAFSGQQIQLTYFAGPDAGIADIYVDGIRVTSLDEHSDSWEWQSTWTSDLLADGTHSLRIIYASGASGTGFTSIDSLTVIP